MSRKAWADLGFLLVKANSDGLKELDIFPSRPGWAVGERAGALGPVEVPPLASRLADELDVPQHDVPADRLAHVVQGEGGHCG